MTQDLIRNQILQILTSKEIQEIKSSFEQDSKAIAEIGKNKPHAAGNIAFRIQTESGIPNFPIRDAVLVEAKEISDAGEGSDNMTKLTDRVKELASVMGFKIMNQFYPLNIELGDAFELNISLEDEEENEVDELDSQDQNFLDNDPVQQEELTDEVPSGSPPAQSQLSLISKFGALAQKLKDKKLEDLETLVGPIDFNSLLSLTNDIELENDEILDIIQMKSGYDEINLADSITRHASDIACMIVRLSEITSAIIDVSNGTNISLGIIQVTIEYILIEKSADIAKLVKSGSTEEVATLITIPFNDPSTAQQAIGKAMFGLVISGIIKDYAIEIAGKHSPSADTIAGNVESVLIKRGMMQGYKRSLYMLMELSDSIAYSIVMRLINSNVLDARLFKAVSDAIKTIIEEKAKDIVGYGSDLITETTIQTKVYEKIKEHIADKANRIFYDFNKSIFIDMQQLPSARTLGSAGQYELMLVQNGQTRSHTESSGSSRNKLSDAIDAVLYLERVISFVDHIAKDSISALSDKISEKIRQNQLSITKNLDILRISESMIGATPDSQRQKREELIKQQAAWMADKFVEHDDIKPIIEQCSSGLGYIDSHYIRVLTDVIEDNKDTILKKMQETVTSSEDNRSFLLLITKADEIAKDLAISYGIKEKIEILLFGNSMICTCIIQVTFKYVLIGTCLSIVKEFKNLSPNADQIAKHLKTGLLNGQESGDLDLQNIQKVITKSIFKLIIEQIIKTNVDAIAKQNESVFLQRVIAERIYQSMFKGNKLKDHIKKYLNSGNCSNNQNNLCCSSSCCHRIFLKLRFNLPAIASAIQNNQLIIAKNRDILRLAQKMVERASETDQTSTDQRINKIKERACLMADKFVEHDDIKVLIESHGSSVMEQITLENVRVLIQLMEQNATFILQIIQQYVKNSDAIKRALELITHAESIAADFLKLLDSQITTLVQERSPHIYKGIMRAVFMYVIISKYWKITQALKNLGDANEVAKLIKNGLLNGQDPPASIDVLNIQKVVVKAIFKVIITYVIIVNATTIADHDESLAVQALIANILIKEIVNPNCRRNVLAKFLSHEIYLEIMENKISQILIGDKESHKIKCSFEYDAKTIAEMGVEGGEAASVAIDINDAASGGLFGDDKIKKAVADEAWKIYYAGEGSKNRQKRIDRVKELASVMGHKIMQKLTEVDLGTDVLASVDFTNTEDGDLKLAKDSSPTVDLDSEDQSEELNEESNSSLQDCGCSVDDIDRQNLSHLTNAINLMRAEILNIIRSKAGEQQPSGFIIKYSDSISSEIASINQIYKSLKSNFLMCRFCSHLVAFH